MFIDVSLLFAFSGEMQRETGSSQECDKVIRMMALAFWDRSHIQTIVLHYHFPKETGLEQDQLQDIYVDPKQVK